MRFSVTAFCLVSISVMVLQVPAEIPQMIGYQGKVTDSGGSPVADGNYTMRFRLYDAASGGTAWWDSGNRTVSVTGGIFNVLLGESPQPSITLTFDEDYWLLVTFAGLDQTPRQRLASASYAYMASGLVPGTEVKGSVTSGTYAAIKGSNIATSGANYGVYGESGSSSGTGVYGLAWADDGLTYGVFGRNWSTSGTGVYGEAASYATSGTGVYGYAVATSGTTTGGFFKTESPNGTGVQGEGDWRGGRFRDTDSNNYCYAGYDTYKTYGTGTNAFVQNHPRDNDRVIVYAAPEGDEVATYTRGTACLIDGEARVPLDETFGWVTNPDIGLTAHLTPRGGWAELYVKSLTTEELVVASRNGTGDAAFDYIVYGLRIGFEEVSIVQEKQEESYIPSMADHRQLYARHPELKKHNSLERFKQMRIAMGITDPVDLSASCMLRDAIEEYDKSIHGPGDKDPGSAIMLNVEEKRAQQRATEEDIIEAQTIR